MAEQTEKSMEVAVLQVNTLAGILRDKNPSLTESESLAIAAAILPGTQITSQLTRVVSKLDKIADRLNDIAVAIDDVGRTQPGFDSSRGKVYF